MYYVNSYLFLEEPEKDWAKRFRRQWKRPLSQACLIREGLLFDKTFPKYNFQRTSGGELCTLEFLRTAIKKS